jgi:hypothetical protein
VVTVMLVPLIHVILWKDVSPLLLTVMMKTFVLMTTVMMILVVLTLLSFVMITMPVLMIPVAPILVVSIPKLIVMIIMNVLPKPVIQIQGVYMMMSLVMIVTCAPMIFASLRLAAFLSLFAVMIQTHVLMNYVILPKVVSTTYIIVMMEIVVH